MRTSGPRRGRAVFFLAVGLGMTGLALLAYGLGFLNDFERQTVDARFAIRGARPPRNVVIVAIDDASLRRLPRWPFPRSIQGRVIDNLPSAAMSEGPEIVKYRISDRSDDQSQEE